MNKIKVLIITGTMNVGGIENQLMHLLRQADSSRFQIDYTSTDPEAYYRQEIETLGGKFFLIPQMDTKNPIPYCKALYRIMKDGQYDVVHSHELFHSGIVLWVAKKAGVPGRFVHAHNWQDGDRIGQKRSLVRCVYNALMRRLILSCSTCQLACSTLAGEFLYGSGALKKDSYHLVFNSVDTGRFLDRYDNPVSGEFCDGWQNVLNVGRVTVVKNQIFLAEIAKELKKRNLKIRILCAGNGDTQVEQQVRTAIEENGLERHMQLLGVRKDIDELMRKASAFVLPSQYEGMPLVLIEAQASGLPCVVADTFSHEVDFEIGKIQWKSLADGAASWADALEQAVTRKRAERQLVEAAVKSKGFDSRCFASTLCGLYEESYERNREN